jgi:hypothetical protein
MSEATQRAAIASVLSGIPDVGVVHDYDRWAVDWGAFIALFKTTIGGKDQIRGWEISRISASEDRTSVRPHTYAIRGYMGLKDSQATEKTFNDLIEAIAAAFRASQDLGKAVLGHDFIQIAVIEPRMFGSVLCHYAELRLTVHEHKYPI